MYLRVVTAIVAPCLETGFEQLITQRWLLALQISKPRDSHVDMVIMKNFIEGIKLFFNLESFTKQNAFFLFVLALSEIILLCSLGGVISVKCAVPQ